MAAPSEKILAPCTELQENQNVFDILVPFDPNFDDGDISDI